MAKDRKILIRLPRPHQSQRAVLSNTARFKTVRCGRRWGKSQLAEITCINRMLRKQHIAYVTPTFGLAKKFFKKILRKLPLDVIVKSNATDLEIYLVTGGMIKFFSGEVLDHFRGWAFHYVVVDEAAYIPDLEEQWKNSIRPTLTDYKGEALFISTPRGRNFFEALFQKGVAGEKGWASFHYSSYDNPYIDPEEIDDAREELPDLVFKQEYLALPSANAANPFGGDNIDNNTIKELSTKPAVVYGIDLAKYKDWTVIIGLDENSRMCHFQRFQLGWGQTKSRIAALPSHVKKVIDATGIGDVIVSDLRDENVKGLHPFVFTTESKPTVIYQLIKDVERNELKFNETTANEMHTYEYQHTRFGKVTFNAQSGFHDDTIAALALANEGRKIVEFSKGRRLVTGKQRRA